MCKKTSSTGNPKHSNVRSQWLSALALTDDIIWDYHQVCSHHFPNGDVTQIPSLTIGERFASPKKLLSAIGV